MLIAGSFAKSWKPGKPRPSSGGGCEERDQPTQNHDREDNGADDERERSL
jgi:hypothetical protein